MVGRAFTALAFAAVFCLSTGSVAGEKSLPLGDFGTITYPSEEHPPDARRTAALIEFVFSLFPSVDVPPTRIEVLSFVEFEETLAQMEAGPNWRAWLYQYRQQTRQTASAVTEIPAARDGRLVVRAFQPLNDPVLVHEILHFIYAQLAPTANDISVLNFEVTVSASMAAVLNSYRYRNWLRERPWIGDGGQT
jgi:hypothetical protein